MPAGSNASADGIHGYKPVPTYCANNSPSLVSHRLPRIPMGMGPHFSNRPFRGLKSVRNGRIRRGTFDIPACIQRPCSPGPHRPFLEGLCTPGGSNPWCTVTHASSAADYRGPESFLPPTISPSVSGSAIAGSSASALSEEFAEVMKLIALLPPKVRSALEFHPRIGELVEIVMDLGRPPAARFPEGDVQLSQDPVSDADLLFAERACGEFGGDNRAGIDGTLHRISAIRNRTGRIVGLTCRVGRSIEGSAVMVRDIATAGKSILLLGRPGVGKTTAIREISRLLADECCRRVVIVDTSNEIGGDGDVPHPGIGGARRMQVACPEQQHKVMIEAVENHMPEVIVIDEIGTEAEALAARTIAQRGVQLVATAHGNELENLMKNPSLNDLVGGIASVTLGDDEAKRRGGQKSVLERQEPPTFDVAVEMHTREQWRVHLDIGHAVDELLLGRDAGAEVRERDGNGQVFAWPETKSTQPDELDGEEEREGSVGLKEIVEGANASGAQRRQRQRLELTTQPFPETALRAARHQATGASQTKSGQTGHSASHQLHVFLHGIDPDSVVSIVGALNLDAPLAIEPRIQKADAILATRARVKATGWIREAARAAKVPLFVVRSSSIEDVNKGVRVILGIDPSPGGTFSAREGSGVKTSRAQAGQKGGMSTGPTPDAIEGGLNEARDAIESIVIALGQPAELLPRPEAIVERQLALARGYGLQTEVVGIAAAGGRRVRVLPPNKAPSIVSASPAVADR